MYYQFHHRDFPKVSFMDRFVSPDNWIHHRRTPGEYILFIIKSGTLYLREGKTSYQLREGDMLLLDPDKEHVGTRVSRTEYYFIHFPASLLETAPIDESTLCSIINKAYTFQQQTPSHAYALYQEIPLFLPKQFHFSDTVSFRRICSLMDTASHSTHYRQHHYKTICSCCFLEILIQISTDFTRELRADSQKAFTQSQLQVTDRLMNFLKEHYVEKLSGKDLEKLFGMNFDYLNRLMKRRTGLTIFACQKVIRLNHAADLIASGKYKSYEIAEMVGIPDVYYFSKAFKEQFGVSPKNYFRIKSTSF